MSVDVYASSLTLLTKSVQLKMPLLYFLVTWLFRVFESAIEVLPRQ